MKYAILLLGILLAAVIAAEAKVDRTCIREQSKTFGGAAAKPICDPNSYVKPNELGWHCELGGKESKFYKAEGGSRLERDAVCEWAITFNS